MKIFLKIFILYSIYIISISRKIDTIILLTEKDFPEENHNYLKKLLINTKYKLDFLKNNNPLIKTDLILIKIPEKSYISLKKYLLKGDFNKIKTIQKDKKIKLNLLENSQKFLPKDSNNFQKFDYKISTKPIDFLLKFPLNFDQNTLKGKNVKIGIFDTGISENYQIKHNKNIKEIINYTKEKFDVHDINGHGTFITSLIVNENEECPGLVPMAELYIFKVFSHKEETYTSWLIEAFNYAIELKLDVVNFSIGSIETPVGNEIFISKLEEVVNSKIVVVSAVGNDGPSFGGVNTPADLEQVIAVGGYDLQNEQIAGFSSKGPTTNELPFLGRVKPDVLAPAKLILGADLDGNCQTKSGSSIATPLVTSAIAIFVGFLKENGRGEEVNPGIIKQVILENSDIIEEYSIFEQGAGVINLTNILNSFQNGSVIKKVSIFPNILNLTKQNVYFYPLSNQPFFAGTFPSIFNLSLINSFEKKNIFLESYELRSNLEEFIDVNVELEKENIFNMSFFAFISIIFKIKKNYDFKKDLTNWVNIEFYFKIYNESIPIKNNSINFLIYFDAIETPPREKRILWDQFHSLNFPQNGFIPRDSLSNFDYPWDWFGDSPYTNYLRVFNYLREKGYFLEILKESFLCFNAENYGSLIIIDSEKKFTDKEINKLEIDIVYYGLSLIVFAEWFDQAVINKSSFYHPFKNKKVQPIIGGANLPALNSLLNNFGINFGNTVFSGDFELNDTVISYYSGSIITKFPKNGYLFSFDLFNESEIILKGSKSAKKTEKIVPILGILPEIFNYKNSGKVIVYGDSNCLDGLNLNNDCFELLNDFLRFIKGEKIPILSIFTHYELPFDYFNNETQSYNYKEWVNKTENGKYFDSFFKRDKENKCIYGKENIKYKELSKKKGKLLEKTEYLINSWSISKSSLKEIDKETNSFGESVQDDKVSIENTIEFQIVIVIFSFVFVCFIFYLLKRKKKKLVSYEDINQDTILIV